MLSNFETRTKIEKHHEVQLIGRDIIDNLRQELKVQGRKLNIPDDAQVIVNIPGGGDWSNTELDIDTHAPVVIKWTETTRSES